jgi:dipeptide/tripeptide permease
LRSRCALARADLGCPRPEPGCIRGTLHATVTPMTTTAAADRPPRSLHDDLAALRHAPRELWLVYAIKLFESIAYFAVYSLLVIYLSDDHGYSDTKAGSVAGTWLTAISLVVFIAGFIADGLGIRRALMIAAVSAAVGRGLLAFAPSAEGAMLGLVVSVWGIACMKPTMNAAVRAYTTSATVAFAFSLYYVVMNLGAVTQGPLISEFRSFFKGGYDLLGHHFSSSQMVFLVAAAVSALNVGLVLLMREVAPAQPELVKVPAQATRNPLSIAREVLRERAFWWFILFVALLTLVRLIFQHAHLTWPKYAIREFGQEFPFATYWSLNPLMIIFLTPVATAFTRKYPPYPVIVIGAMLSALSVFALAFSTTVAASVTFIVVLSLGEALWSPRLYEYTATVAPRGREASYMGLSEVPLFLAKPVVGFMSGALLETYCPATGPRDSTSMWWIVGLSTIAAPTAMLAWRRWLDRVPKEVAV